MSTDPQPVCGHRPRGTVVSGDPRKGPFVSTPVCHRVECIAAAEEWVHAQTGGEVRYVPIDRSR